MGSTEPLASEVEPELIESGYNGPEEFVWDVQVVVEPVFELKLGVGRMPKVEAEAAGAESQAVEAGEPVDLAVK